METGMQACGWNDEQGRCVLVDCKRGTRCAWGVTMKPSRNESMKMTTIHLTSPSGLVIGKPSILWPPEDGEPEIIFAATKVFIRSLPQAPGTPPTYREARSMGITNIDF